MISNTFPYPPTRGGTQVRTFNLLKYLHQYHNVTLVTQIDESIINEEIEELKYYVKDLFIFSQLEEVDKKGLLGKFARFAKFIISATPPNVKSSYHPHIQLWINQALSEGRFDVITCEHIVNEIYIKSHWQNKVKTIVNIHSSVYRTCESQLLTGTAENGWRDLLYLPLLYRYEKRYCQKFSQLVVTTDEDKESIAKISGKSEISVIPNGVDLELFPFRDFIISNHQLIIAGGMDYSVNIDSALHFSLEVLPLIQDIYDDTQLLIVGANPAPSILALGEKKGITVTGKVPKMVDYLHQASVAVIPMRSGFGIKNKTLEAMAAGIPVVGSDRGLEGLQVDKPLSALRANKIEEYIEKISLLFENPDLCQEMAQNARLMIEQNFTWQQAGKKYEELMN
ncbi:MAG: glycosyltransferase [Cyanobacterium sp. T60_A2020_053]|nr:glycosyltransferase [Cyanobacterium sp. T60_A2020_053]